MVIEKLSEILAQAREEYEKAQPGNYRDVEAVGTPVENLLVYGENISFMKHLAGEGDLAGKLKLIYVDPPFYSGSNYQAVLRLESPHLAGTASVKPLAYDDRWEKGMPEYLTMLCARLMMMRDLLREDGSIWVHLDWHVVHYVKILMDAIFGEKCFINEIIWTYKSGGTSKNHFARKHDTLLFYGKSPRPDLDIPQEKSYNREFKPYRFKGVKEYRDELGWYTMVNMKDVWQIDMVGRTSGERTGYATQKPEALIRRILEACTKEGEICADFFCGAGTLAAVASKTGRLFIACDMGPLAVAATEKRLLGGGAPFRYLADTGLDSPEAGDLALRAEFPDTSFSGSGKRLLRLTLEAYAPRVDLLPLDEDGRAAVREMAAADSLQLIDFWSADPSYDGLCHRPTQVFAKGRDRVETSWEVLVDHQDQVSVRVCDIFGNCFTKVLRLPD
jgi:DNA modification methylase